ncbi:MAG: ATPase P [Deltaproteobacteria bacterium]
MLAIDVPGFKELRLEYLVLDYNGTLACHGQLLAGVREKLAALAPHLEIHILTADTFGMAQDQVAHLPVRLIVLPPGKQAQAKCDHVRRLGGERTAALGNGRNDRLMLAEAVLGICVLLEEGVAVETLTAAQVVAPGILAALDLLLVPNSLKATLRD